MPMIVGNSWSYYSFHGGIYNERIVDSSFEQGAAFYQFDTLRHYPGYSLYYLDAERVGVKMGANTGLWLDFGATVGQPYTVRFPGTEAQYDVTLESRSDTVTVAAGTFTDCYKFHWDFHGADNDFDEWYAPGVGLVMRILYGFGIIEYELAQFDVRTPTSTGTIPDAATSLEVTSLYPNPAVDRVSMQIQVTAGQREITLLVSDALGRTVRSETVGVRENEFVYNLNLNGLQPGTYYYRLISGETAAGGALSVR